MIFSLFSLRCVSLTGSYHSCLCCCGCCCSLRRRNMHLSWRKASERILGVPVGYQSQKFSLMCKTQTHSLYDARKKKKHGKNVNNTEPSFKIVRSLSPFAGSASIKISSLPNSSRRNWRSVKHLSISCSSYTTECVRREASRQITCSI